jgi:hypothetical protein
MAVVETNPMKTRVRHPEKDFIVSTNHLNHPDMRRIEIFESPDSWLHHNRVMEQLTEHGRINEKVIQGILNDHSGQVCSHIDDIGLGPLWLTVTHLNTLRIWRARAPVQ